MEAARTFETSGRVHSTVSRKAAVFTFWNCETLNNWKRCVSISLYSDCIRTGRLGFESRQWHDIYLQHSVQTGSRVSSGRIVSDYGLDDRAIGVRSPAGAKEFSSSLCVQTGSGVHPASCTMGTGGPFPGGKERPGRDADHSPQSSAEVVNE
jgi:hypothetical protein